MLSYNQQIEGLCLTHLKFIFNKINCYVNIKIFNIFNSFYNIID